MRAARTGMAAAGGAMQAAISRPAEQGRMRARRAPSHVARARLATEITRCARPGRRRLRAHVARRAGRRRRGRARARRRFWNGC